MNIKISRKLFKEKAYQWLYVVFVTLLPQLIYLGTYINNDSLALFSISIIVYGWILGLESDWDWKSCITMAIGIGICALSYYNAYGYILCSIIIYFVSGYIKKMNIKEFLKKGIAIFAIAFAIGGWWFIRSYILYDGDFIAFNIQREYGERYAIEEYKPSKRATPQHQGVTLNYMLKDMQWIDITVQSFIGRFGYMNTIMDERVYTGYKLVAVIGAIGIAFGWIKTLLKKIIMKKRNQKEKVNKTKRNEKILFNTLLIISMIITIALSLYYSYFSDFQPQGRYVMPIEIPLMYFIVIGIKNLCDVIIKNRKVKNIVIWIAIIIWSILPLIIICKYILPKFHI